MSTSSDFSVIADGLTAAEVAEWTGVDEDEAQRWLAGAEPPAEHIDMLVVATGLDADQWPALAAEMRQGQPGDGAPPPEPAPIALPATGGHGGGDGFEPAGDGETDDDPTSSDPPAAPPLAPPPPPTALTDDDLTSSDPPAAPPAPQAAPLTVDVAAAGAARVAARAGVLLASDPETVAAIAAITGRAGLDAVDAAETVAGFGPEVSDALRRVAGFLDRLGR